MTELQDQSVAELLSAIGAKAPTPGGGAVASLTAASGAALGLMVVAYSEGRRTLAEHAALHEEARRTLETLRERAIRLADADAEAYGRLNALWKLDEADERRRREFAPAVRGAIEVPAEVLDVCLDMLDLFQRLGGRVNRMLLSDLAIAALLAEAGARAASWNVHVNLPLLDDAAEAERLAAETARLLARARERLEAIETACRPPVKTSEPANR